MKAKAQIGGVLCLLVCMVMPAIGQPAAAPDAVKYSTNDQGVVIDGYDPVSFTKGTPKQGKASFSTQFDGVKFWFANAANKAAFTANPKQFVPAFGGYCAFGVRMGKKHDPDPAYYKVVGGKLYMLQNRATKAMWAANAESNISKAVARWTRIKGFTAQELTR